MFKSGSFYKKIKSQAVYYVSIPKVYKSEIKPDIFKHIYLIFKKIVMMNAHLFLKIKIAKM